MWSRFSSGRSIAAALLLPLSLACAPLSLSQERALGEQANDQIRAELPLIKDRVVWDYVREIGHRIVTASGEQPFTYHFYVVADEGINAFALPAGYIYVNAGILIEARDVSEVAGVMGHEVGHVVKRHVANNYSRQQGVGLLHRIGVYTAAILGGSLAGSAANAAGGVASTAYLSTFGRDAEREADAFAVEVLPRAGYDPHGLVTFFETMRRAGGASPPVWLSSHPATDERIANTQRMIEARTLPAGLRTGDDGRLHAIQRRLEELRRR
jgi:predicted Zn-dependent protease